MHRYVHVSIAYAAIPFDVRRLELPVNSLASDWVRYTPTCWILWTDRPLSVVSQTLKAYLGPSDNIMALSINPHDTPAGHMPQWVWDWYNRYRDPVTGQVNWPPPQPVGGLAPPAGSQLPNGLLGGLNPGSPLAGLLGLPKLPK
jgi:hypothetical protein